MNAATQNEMSACPECEAMGYEEECIICLGTGEVENVTKINAMDAAHREIRRSMRALAIASTMLEDAEMPSACEALSAAYDILGIINEALYEKIHTDHEE